MADDEQPRHEPNVWDKRDRTHKSMNEHVYTTDRDTETKQGGVRFSSNPRAYPHQVDVDYDIVDDDGAISSASSVSETGSETENGREDDTRLLIKDSSVDDFEYLVSRPAVAHKPRDTIMFEGRMDLETEFASTYDKLAKKRLDTWQASNQKSQQQQQQGQRRHKSRNGKKKSTKDYDHVQKTSSVIEHSKSQPEFATKPSEADTSNNINKSIVNDSITTVYAPNSYRLERMPGRRKRSENRPSTSLKSGYDGFFKPLEQPSAAVQSEYASRRDKTQAPDIFGAGTKERTTQYQAGDLVRTNASPVFHTVESSNARVATDQTQRAMTTGGNVQRYDTDESGLELTPVKQHRSQRQRQHHHRVIDDSAHQRRCDSKQSAANSNACRCCECCWCRLGGDEDDAQAHSSSQFVDSPASESTMIVSRRCTGCRRQTAKSFHTDNDDEKIDDKQHSSANIILAKQQHRSTTTTSPDFNNDAKNAPESQAVGDNNDEHDDGRGPIRAHDSHGHLMNEYNMHPQEDNFDSYERYAPRHDLTAASNKRPGAGLPSGDRLRLDVRSARMSKSPHEDHNISGDSYYSNTDGNNASNSDQIGSNNASHLKYTNLKSNKSELVEQNRKDDKLYKTCQNQHFSIFDNEYPDPLFEVPEHLLNSQRGGATTTSTQGVHFDRPAAGSHAKTYNNLFGESPDSMFMCMNPEPSSSR